MEDPIWGMDVITNQANTSQRGLFLYLLDESITAHLRIFHLCDRGLPYTFMCNFVLICIDIICVTWSCFMWTYIYFVCDIYPDLCGFYLPGPWFSLTYTYYLYVTFLLIYVFITSMWNLPTLMSIQHVRGIRPDFCVHVCYYCVIIALFYMDITCETLSWFK